MTGNNVIAWRQECKQRIADRGHAARKTGGGLSSLQIPYLFLECSYGRVCIPAINMAGRLSLGHIEPLVDIVVSERDAKGDWNLSGTLPGIAILASPHSSRAKSRWVFFFT